MVKARTAHYLKGSSGGALPKRFAVFAVASEPRGIGTFGVEMLLRSWYGIELRQWHPSLQGEYVIASEEGGFDIASWHEWARAMLVDRARLDIWSCFTSAACAQLGMWKELEGGRWKIIERNERVVRNGKLETPWTGQAVIGDPPFILVVRPQRGMGTIRLLDVRNLDVDGWEGMRLPALAEGKETLAEFAKRVQPYEMAQHLAQICKRYLCDWIRTIKDQSLGAFKVTTASQAWEALRYRFLTEPILCHNKSAVQSLEMDSYHPGRAEAYRIGKVKGPIYQLDINSCYPAIVMRTPLPVRLVKYHEGPEIDVAGCIGRGFSVIAECLISTSKPYFPKRRGGIAIYPTGQFATTLAGPELELALLSGSVEGIIRAAVYEPSDALQSVTEWAIALRAAAKLSGQVAKGDVAKRLINSLYGRFAQHVRQWTTMATSVSDSPYWNRYEVDPETRQLSHYRSIAYMIQKEEDLGLSPDAVVAIPATINSAARVFLGELIQMAGAGNVFYVATDSLLVNAEGLAALGGDMQIYPGEPGKLKLASKHDWIDIHGVGHVESPETMKAAGIPADARGNHKDGFAWDSYERPAGALSRGKRPGALLVPRRASYKGSYRHGLVRENGEVIPFELREF